MVSHKPQELDTNSLVLTDFNVEGYFESVVNGKDRQKAKPQEFEKNSTRFTDLRVEEPLNDCVGFFNCSEPGKCSDYQLCLKEYLNAEERNEMLKL